MILTGNASTPNNISPMTSTGNLPRNILLDPLPGLGHLTAFAVDWSCEELEVLKRGLVTLASEPNIMKYIKIAARLPEKTVRDVAIRCQWMTEKMIGCSSMVNMHYNQLDSEAACSDMMCDGNHMNQFSSEVIDSRTMNLLEYNAKLLHQIAVNSENNEIQNNIDLLYRTNNNITAILNSMLEMPGIMSQMPPLPVYANAHLLHSIFASTSQVHGHGHGHGISYHKEEPSCCHQVTGLLVGKRRDPSCSLSSSPSSRICKHLLFAAACSAPCWVSCQVCSSNCSCNTRVASPQQPCVQEKLLLLRASSSCHLQKQRRERSDEKPAVEDIVLQHRRTPSGDHSTRMWTSGHRSDHPPSTADRPRTC